MHLWYSGFMACRKVTFSLPEDLAIKFLRRVPARDRSRYVAEAIAEKLSEKERQFIRSCEVANADADVLAIEQEFDVLPEEITEPWTDASSR
jgi:ubiquinone biosynthesis protein UbiJ